MLHDIQEEAVKFLLRVQVGPETPVPAPRVRQPVALGGRGSGAGGANPHASPAAREQRKIGRNDPCWCGSGKKFKKCHGRDV